MTGWRIIGEPSRRKVGKEARTDAGERSEALSLYGLKMGGVYAFFLITTLGPLLLGDLSLQEGHSA
jgi:hypothetical protein